MISGLAPVLVESPITTVARFTQLQKVCEPIEVTELGIETEVKPLQLSNAEAPMVVTVKE